MIRREHLEEFRIRLLFVGQHATVASSFRLTGESDWRLTSLKPVVVRLNRCDCNPHNLFLTVADIHFALQAPMR